MNKDIKFSLGSLKNSWQKLTPLARKHGSFAAILFVLIIYLLIVWQISSYASAEPNDSEVQTAISSSAVPKIDDKAIEQIQKLEQNSPQVQALFNQARNNPFQE